MQPLPLNSPVKSKGYTDPQSSNSAGVKPGPPVSAARKTFLSVLIFLFCLVQVVQAGLAFYSFIFAIKESNRAADEKAEGTFQVVEMKYNKTKGYFIANLETTNLSVVNGTYNIMPDDIETSPLRLCYFYSNKTLAADTATTLKSSQALNSVKFVLAMLIVLDLIDSFKVIIAKVQPYVEKYFAGAISCMKKMLCIPNYKEEEETELSKRDIAARKLFILLLVASPRYMSLHFTGEDYSNCVGFTEDDPFYQIFTAFFSPSTATANTIQTWNTDTSDVGFAIYMVYVALFFVVLAFFSFIPYLPPGGCRKKYVKICVLVAFLICLFGLGYFVFNYWLLAAQIKKKTEVYLSIIYIGRDGLNIIILTMLGIVDSQWQRFQELVQQAKTIGGTEMMELVRDKVTDKINENVDAFNDKVNMFQNDPVAGVQYVADNAGDKLEARIEKEKQYQAKLEADDAKKKEKETQNQNRNVNDTEDIQPIFKK